MNPELHHAMTHIDAANSPFCLFNEQEANDVFEKEMHMAFSGSNRIHQCRTHELQEKLKQNELDYDKTISVDPETGLVTRNEQKIDGKHSQYAHPEYIFIFDDISNELRDPFVAHLHKTNRHYLAKIITSSQYPNDMMPSSCKQQDYWLLFAGHSEDKLAKIFKDCDTRISFDKFVQVYKQVTSVPYQFLLIDVANDQYRRNFDATPISVKASSVEEQNKSDAKVKRILDEQRKQELDDYNDTSSTM